MNVPLPVDPHAHLRHLGPPLAELVTGRLRPPLHGALAAALELDRATRDRLVLFEPAVARLIRPLIVAADLKPWSVAAAGRWIVAVPADLAPTLAELHPNLARHLAALTPPSSPSTAEPWWALPPAAAVPAPTPRLLLAGDGVCAWDESPALVAGPATMIAPAEPLWLALLASTPGRSRVAEHGLDGLPVPALPGPVAANLEGLALAAHALARQIDELERAVLTRLVRDFGPPGASPGPRLCGWWELSFDELHAAVLGELHNDIPARFRPTWQELHADQRATHADALARLAALQGTLDSQVATLYRSEA